MNFAPSDGHSHFAKELNPRIKKVEQAMIKDSDLSKEYNDYLVPFCIVIKSWKWWIFRKIMKEYSFYCPVNERLLVRHPKFKLQSDKLL